MTATPFHRPRALSALSAAALALLSACADPEPAAPLADTGPVSAAGSNAQALFVNPGFEDGNLNGWSVSTALVNRATQPVDSEENLNLSSGGTNRTSVKYGAPLTLIPPGLTSTDTVRYPRYGNHAAIVNEQGLNRNLNRLVQTSAVTAADIDPHDGRVHVRFVVLPVMQNPGHTLVEQPYYFVSVNNLTRGTNLASRFNFSNQAGVPWQSNSAGSVVYTDWLLFDLPLSPADVAIGDVLEVRVLAAGCQPSGHWGQAIVDAFGTDIPGIAVYASGPDSVAAGDDFQYSYRIFNGGAGTATGVKLMSYLPAGVSFRSVDTPGVRCTTPTVGVRGTVACDLPPVSAGGAQQVRITVRADATATQEIRHGWYSIESAQEPALIGPLVVTQVAPAGTAHHVDLVTSVDNGKPALEWGQQVTYAVTVKNQGQATAANARITSNLPAELSGLTWQCAPSPAASCGVLTGTGEMDTLVTLPPRLAGDVHRQRGGRHRQRSRPAHLQGQRHGAPGHHRAVPHQQRGRGHRRHQHPAQPHRAAGRAGKRNRSVHPWWPELR